MRAGGILEPMQPQLWHGLDEKASGELGTLQRSLKHTGSCGPQAGDGCLGCNGGNRLRTPLTRGRTQGPPGIKLNTDRASCVCPPSRAPFATWPAGLGLLAAPTVSALGRGSNREQEPAGLPFPTPPLPAGAGAAGLAPFFLASVMMSAALLLITLVMYTGQLIRPAMVMARNTASASSCGRSKDAGHRRGGRGAAHPELPRRSLVRLLRGALTECGQGEIYCIEGGK